MRSYETVFIFRPNEETFQRGLTTVRGRFEALQIKITKEENMGEKTLAYPIDKSPSGRYYLFELETEPERLPEIRDALKHNDDMLRFLLVRKDD